MLTRDVQIPVSRGRLPAVGIETVVGLTSAAVLYERYVVPKRDTRRKSGYQREPSGARVNRLVTDLRRARVSLPTAVLLNLRKYQPSKHLQTKGSLTFFQPLEEQLHVVDGQHRILALAKLIEEDEQWATYPIAFVCMLGADERQEMEQFYVVNSTAKSVRTDLAFDLLKQRAETDADVLDSLTERGEGWKVKAQTLVEALADTSVWKGRIRFPSDAKGDTTITSSGMAASLKNLLDTPFFEGLKSPDQVRILDAYWRSVRHVVQPAFDDPSRYTIQKSVGVMVLHPLLVSVLENVRSQGDSVLEPDSYTKLLRKPLTKLEGETGDGIVTGAEFWLAGPAGAAGAFSSNAGRRLLLSRMKSLLPRLSIE
jgi:DGQHR domain-containing protein